MSPLRFSIAVCAALLSPAIAAAKPVLYECDVTSKIVQNGWISPKFAFVVQDDGSAVVADSVVLHFKKKPIPVKLRDRGGKLRLSWNVTGTKDRKGTRAPQFSYTASIDKASSKFFVKGRPVPFPQSWSATGTCKTRTDGKLPKVLR